MTSAILLVITASDRARRQTYRSALLFFGGGLPDAVSIAAWPLQRYRPRTALMVCRQLAASARRPTSQPAPVSQALTDVENLHGTFRPRFHDGSVPRARGIVGIRLELLALGGLRTHRQPCTGRPACAGMPRALDSVAGALDAGVSPLAAAAALEGYEAAMSGIDRPEDSGADAHARRVLTIALAHAHALAGQLRALARNAEFAGSRGELRLDAEESRFPRALRPRNAFAILRANMRLSSIACRHALRCAVCLAIAVAGARLTDMSHGYWIPMTAAIVLKPDFAGTFSFPAAARHRHAARACTGYRAGALRVRWWRMHFAVFDF
jgi:hypothetical protein